MSTASFPFSFDEQGTLLIRGDEVRRRLGGSLPGVAARLRDGNALDRLQAAGMIESDLSVDASEVLHTSIPFVTYPQEWTLRMLQQAALCTLDVAIELNRLDLSLQDPHAWNVTFRAGRPVYVDFSSMIPGRGLHPRFLHDLYKSYYVPLWLASCRLCARRLRQFAYAVMNAEHEWRMWQQPRAEWRKLFDEAQLGRLCRRFHGLVRQHAGERDPLRLLVALRAHVAELDVSGPSRQVDGAGSPPPGDPSAAQRRHAVEQLLRRLPVGRLLDLTCEDGALTAIAARLGHTALGCDVEESDIDAGQPLARSNSFDLARMNLAWPTPPQGAFLMYPAAYQRFAADTVMLAGALHRIAMKQRIKFGSLVAMAQRYGARQVVVEWIPPDDPAVRALAVGDGVVEVPEWYRREAFEAAWTSAYPAVERIDVGAAVSEGASGEATRSLYLFRVGD